MMDRQFKVITVPFIIAQRALMPMKYFAGVVPEYKIAASLSNAIIARKPIFC